MKRFQIQRDEDNTGLSGLGIVAEGVEFTNGKVVLCWMSNYSTIVHHENMESVQKISCSHSKSQIVFLDN